MKLDQVQWMRRSSGELYDVRHRAAWNYKRWGRWKPKPKRGFPSLYQWAYFQDPWLIEPDWDDNDSDLVVAYYTHAVGTVGHVGLHPDGQTHDDFGVPLIAHEPDVTDATKEYETVEMLARKELHRKAMAELELKKEAERKAQREEELREAYRKPLNEAFKPPEGYPRRAQPVITAPAPRRFYAALDLPEEQLRRQQQFAIRSAPEITKEEQMLRDLKIDTALFPGTGRVFANLVLLNEADSTNPAFMQAGWKEVWRGRGLVIYSRLMPSLPGEGVSWQRA